VTEAGEVRILPASVIDRRRADNGQETAMATLYDFSSTSRFATRPNWIVRATQALLNTYRAFKNRREFYRLGELSDAELADIGLTRADLHVAVGHPFGSDPTASLSVIVRRRVETEQAARSVC
jgi:uncharacterized protein YjiS (DUF1127 family)